jgi:hypothetical protein
MCTVKVKVKGPHRQRVSSNPHTTGEGAGALPLITSGAIQLGALMLCCRDPSLLPWPELAAYLMAGEGGVANVDEGQIAAEIVRT